VSRFFLAAVFVLCLPALLQAQYNPYRSPAGRQQAALQPMEISGTIRVVARSGIAVTNSNNQTWRVAIVPATKVQAGTKVQVTGTTTADSLRSGLIVEFTAEIDSRGAIQGKVDALTVTSLTREKQMGVFPSGADSGFGGNVIDDSPKPAKRPGPTTAKSGHATGKAAAHAQTGGSCRIVGQLVVGHGGSLSVKAGRGSFSFGLADQAKISVDVADLSLARPGLEVSVKGFVSPRQPGIIQAAEVKVKLPEPQVADKADKKEPAVKPEAKKPAKRSKKDQGEGLPELPADK